MERMSFIHLELCKVKRLLIIYSLFIGLIYIGPASLYANQSEGRLGSTAENLKKIMLSQKLIDQGIANLRQYSFDKAAELFNESTAQEYYFDGVNFGYAKSKMVKAYQYDQQYQKALEALDWFFQQRRVGERTIDEKRKFQALIKWESSGDTKAIYGYIQYIQQKYGHRLPPKEADILIFSDIAELYDLIGDYDTGIVWAASFKKTTKDKRDEQEYQNVIKAFEESKQDMPKICGDEGRTCVGRATAYIIQSDQI